MLCMIFIFLLEEDSICKNLSKGRKYMADEEISEWCEHVNTVPKESKAIPEVCYAYF